MQLLKQHILESSALTVTAEFLRHPSCFDILPPWSQTFLHYFKVVLIGILSGFLFVFWSFVLAAVTHAF